MIFLLIGYLIGKLGFLKYQDITRKKNEKYYFIQVGVFSNDDFINQWNKMDMKDIIMEYKENKNYIYCAITRDLEVVERIMKIYEKKGQQTNYLEKYIPNEELKNNVEQFDLLVKTSSVEEEILKIEEVVLATYEEIMKKYDE